MIVLFLTEKLRCGGRERRLTRLLCALSERYPDHEFHLALCSTDFFYNEIKKANIHLHFLKLGGIFTRLKGLFGLLRMLHPDVVQGWTIYSSFYLAVLQPFFHYRFISSHIADAFGPSSFQYRAMGWVINCFADKIVSNSIAGLNAYKAPSRKSTVVYNGYEIQECHKLVENSGDSNLFRPNSRIVLMVANVTRNKDYDTFVKTARIVTSRFSDVFFVSAGGGEFLEKYRNQINNEEKNRIIFLGRRSDIDALVEQCSIGLLCTYKEGVSNSILEYMAHKKPVVATGDGGTCEIVQDGFNGFLCEAGQPARVAECIIKLLENPAKSKEYGENGYKLVTEKFSMDQSVLSYMKLYEQI